MTGMVAQGLPLGLTGPGWQPIAESRHSILRTLKGSDESSRLSGARFRCPFRHRRLPDGARFLPRTHTSPRSLDGRYAAFVHQGLNPDPPGDHLYLGPAGQSARYLRALAPDADWSRAIVWSPDSRTMGFVINEQRLALFDTATASEIAILTLVKADGYPGSEEARAISIANEGVVTFDRYRRATMLLQTRQGVIETSVTIFGTYGRPIHRAEQLIGRDRLQVSTAVVRART
jgi:hypothetical protein